MIPPGTERAAGQAGYWDLTGDESNSAREGVAFRRLADLGPVIVWMTDSSGALTFLNRRWVEYTGFDIGDTDWTAILHPEDYVAAVASFRRGVQDFDHFRFEARLRRLDGEWRWHEVTGGPIGDQLPGVGLVGHAIDIHDRKSTSDMLRDQRDVMWELSSDLKAVLDLRGVVEIVNPAWKELLGLGDADMRHRQIRDFVDPASLPFFDGMFADLVRSGGDASLEFVVRNGDVARAVSWTGKARGGRVYLAGRDLTHERRAAAALEETQEELRQSQKMEAIGQLTGGIAHDFNNLLTGIIGGLSMAQNKIRNGKADEVQRFLDMAFNSAKKAGSLTHRLLAFSRRQSLEVRTVDANAVVGSMTELLSRTVGDAIAVRTDLSADQLAVRIDTNQLENALLNLAINARDAMSGSGMLTISTSAARHRRKADAKAPVPDGDYVVIAVSDTGMGMDPQTVERAAEPFFTTKAQGEGTGLGLSMVYGFVEQSGGVVRIDSEIGRGTTVKLWIPLSTDPIPEVRTDGDLIEEDAGEEVKVMIVEDHEMVRMLASDILTTAGYEVSAFEDGESALDAIRDGASFEVLLTDVGLPGIDGRDLATEVLRLLPGTAVVFVTGHGEGEIVNAGSWGKFETVIKPFAMRELTGKVADAARRAAAAKGREVVS